MSFIIKPEMLDRGFVSLKSPLPLHVGIQEFIANALDAGANKIVILMRGDSVFVMDNGHGMEEDQAQNYFNFGTISQKTSEMTRGHRGVGMSLSLLSCCKSFSLSSKPLYAKSGLNCYTVPGSEHSLIVQVDNRGSSALHWEWEKACGSIGWDPGTSHTVFRLDSPSWPESANTETKRKEYLLEKLGTRYRYSMVSKKTPPFDIVIMDEKGRSEYVKPIKYIDQERSSPIPGPGRDENGFLRLVIDGNEFIYRAVYMNKEQIKSANNQDDFLKANRHTQGLSIVCHDALADGLMDDHTTRIFGIKRHDTLNGFRAELVCKLSARRFFRISPLNQEVAIDQKIMDVLGPIFHEDVSYCKKMKNRDIEQEKETKLSNVKKLGSVSEVDLEKEIKRMSSEDRAELEQRLKNLLSVVNK
jgi:hypothetical protein